MLEIIKEMKNARKEGPPEKIRYSTANKVKGKRNEGKFKGGESTMKKKKKTNRQSTDWCLLWVVDIGQHFIKLIQVADHILYALPLSFTKTVAREYLGGSRSLSLSLSLWYFIVPFLCINHGDPWILQSRFSTKIYIERYLP